MLMTHKDDPGEFDSEGGPTVVAHAPTVDPDVRAQPRRRGLVDSTSDEVPLAVWQAPSEIVKAVREQRDNADTSKRPASFPLGQLPKVRPPPYTGREEDVDDQAMTRLKTSPRAETELSHLPEPASRPPQVSASAPTSRPPGGQPQGPVLFARPEPHSSPVATDLEGWRIALVSFILAVAILSIATFAWLRFH
jgi:hypothetical protein